MLELFEGNFSGIGSGFGEYGPVPARLIPSAAADFRTVRLFCAVTETDYFLVE